MRRGKVYIAGPMTGYEDHNCDAFRMAEERLKKEKYRFGEVVNPFEIIEKHGRDGAVKGNYASAWAYLENNRKAYDECVKEEMDVLSGCTAICLLKGWENSVGSRRELACALEHDMEIVIFGGDGNWEGGLR